MRADAFGYGLWKFRAGTGNFAWAGIDMALADICGKASASRSGACSAARCATTSTISTTSRAATTTTLRAQCQGGARGRLRRSSTSRSASTTARTEHMVATLRDALGPARGCASTPTELVAAAGAAHARAAGRVRHRLRRAARARDPRGQLGELRRARRWPCARTRACGRRTTPTRASARARPTSLLLAYWVGSLAAFSRLAHVAELEGLQVCKHTHGELGITAAACQHVLLTLPNIVDGHQQTAQMMVHDVLTSRCRSPTARLGRHRRARARRRGRRGRRRRGGRALPQRGPVPALAAVPARARGPA